VKNHDEHHFAGCDDENGLEKCKCDFKRYLRVAGVSFGILVFQLIGSLVSGSLALLADSVHVAMDALALAMNAGIEYLAIKKFKLFNEVLVRLIGGLMSVVILFFLAMNIGLEAISRLDNPPAIASWLMISVAVIGGLGNYWQHRILHHSHSEHITQKSAEKHVLSDLWQSVAVVVGGVFVASGYPIADPLISLLVAINILFFAIGLFKSIVKPPPFHTNV